MEINFTLDQVRLACPSNNIRSIIDISSALAKSSTSPQKSNVSHECQPEPFALQQQKLTKRIIKVLYIMVVHGGTTWNSYL